MKKGFCGGLPINEILKYRFSVGLFPISSVSAAAQGMIRVLGELSESGSTVNIRELMTDPPTRVHEMMGEKDWQNNLALIIKRVIKNNILRSGNYVRGKESKRSLRTHILLSLSHRLLF